jgi:CRP/FNR family transcriptional regulator, cyclic AMP receptor protein
MQRSAASPNLRALREAPAKTTLRALLSENSRRLGLTAAAIEDLVRQSHITHWRAGQAIFTEADDHDLVSFLVAGAVRVVCPGRGGRPVTVQIVRPGQFFGLASLFESRGPRILGAIAHVDAVVAVMSQETLSKVLGALPPRRALQPLAYSWRALSRLLYEKCLLLTLPLGERVTHQLAVLAQDFGEPHAEGVCIALPVTQADLADLVAGSRANVSRCLAALQRARQIVVRDRRIVLTKRFVAPPLHD